MKNKIKLPKWILKRDKITQAEWKKRKRKEIKDVKKAFEVYRAGCYYCPGTWKEKDDLGELLNKMIDDHKCKNW